MENIRKIKCTRKETKDLGAGGGVAKFDSKGFATVDKKVGEALAAAYPNIVEVVEKEEKTTRTSTKEE